MNTAQLIESHEPPIMTKSGELTAAPTRGANDNSIMPTLDLHREGLTTAPWPVPVMPRLVPRMPPAPLPSMPPAPLPSMPPLVGITGKRDVGKSTVAKLLAEKFGFKCAHAFDGGKEAAAAYFKHITGSDDLACRMVYGDLKDKPSEYLPGGVAPRFFLEKFGHFMGVTMGVDWTLAMEIARLRRLFPGSPIVVESLVYEAPWFRRQGGRIIRMDRPDHEGPTGIASDSVQAGIIADEVICNDGSIADLQARVRKVLEGWG